MSEVDRLVSKLTEVIGQAGGEAARIWPDMVAAYAFSAWIGFGLSCLVAVILQYVTCLCFFKAVRYQPRDSYDDTRFGWVMGGVAAGIVALVATTSAGLNLGSVLYPEANLVRQLLSR